MIWLLSYLSYIIIVISGWCMALTLPDPISELYPEMGVYVQVIYLGSNPRKHQERAGKWDG